MFSTPSKRRYMLKLLHKGIARKEVYTVRSEDLIPWEIRELRVEFALSSPVRGKITFPYC
jgi:hypothetical protein